MIHSLYKAVRSENGLFRVFFFLNKKIPCKTVLGDAIVTNYVKNQARKLAKDTTNSVINDPQVQANLSGMIHTV